MHYMHFSLSCVIEKYAQTAKNRTVCPIDLADIIFCIYLLVMQKYWEKQIFSLGRFPEVGQKQD